MAHLVVVLLVVKDMNPNRIKHFFWSVTNHKNMILYAILCKGVLQQKWLSLNIDEYIWFIEMAGWYRINAEIILNISFERLTCIIFPRILYFIPKIFPLLKMKDITIRKVDFCSCTKPFNHGLKLFSRKIPILKSFRNFFPTMPSMPFTNQHLLKKKTKFFGKRDKQMPCWKIL